MWQRLIKASTSAFFVFLNLPPGRKATLAYVKKRAAFTKPVLPHAANQPARLNPNLPQLPAELEPSTRRQQEEAALIWKRKAWSWGLLEGLIYQTAADVRESEQDRARIQSR